LSNKLFDIDAQVRQLPGSAKTRQLIVDTSLEYLQRLRGDVQGDPSLALDVASAYRSVAEVEGVGPGVGNLGHMDLAERDLKIAEDMVQSVLASQPANRAALLCAAQIAADRRLLAKLSYRSADEVAWARKTVERLEAFHPGPGDQTEAPQILLSYSNAVISLAGANPEEALPIAKRGSDLARLFHLPLQTASFLTVTAEVLRQQGDLEEALKDAHEAVVLRDPSAKTSLGRIENFVYASRVEGEILGQTDGISLGRYREATPILERAFEMADGIVHQNQNEGTSRSYLMGIGLPLANVVRRTDPARALSIYDHVLQHLSESKTTVLQIGEAYFLSESSYSLRSLGRDREARQRLDRALARLTEFKLYPVEKIDLGTSSGEAVITVLGALGDHEAATGNLAGGMEIYQKLLALFAAGAAKPETRLSDAMTLSRIWESATALYRRGGRAELASTLEARRSELWRQWDRKLPNNPFVRQQLTWKATSE
jgi:serine/threonine-protein kinase